jgi:hypothetical protein
VKLLTALLPVVLCSSAFAASPVAYVYVQPPVGGTTTTAPIHVYSAASDGKLTQIKDSPFTQTTGNIIGTNGSFLVTEGSGYVFSYAVESSGGIGKLVSKINTSLYTGSKCGTSEFVNTGSGEFDHTGKYVYISLGTLSEACELVQTYAVSKTGELTFQGKTDADNWWTDRPVVTGNNEFAESLSSHNGITCCNFTAFSRESSTGVLNVIKATETDPTPNPSSDEALVPVTDPSPDPTDHLAVAVWPENGGTFQLASYTVNSHGDTISTNTWENMPSLLESAHQLKLDPTGKYLAVATGTGVQIFYFNGAKPISKFTEVVGTSGYIATMAWDGSGHLYAINGDSGKLHVYEGTTKSVKEVSGSPYDNACGTDDCTLIVRIIP